MAKGKKGPVTNGITMLEIEEEGEEKIVFGMRCGRQIVRIKIVDSEGNELTPREYFK